MFQITPKRVAMMYHLLRGLPPFSRWSLPETVDVRFHTPCRRDVYGEHCHKRGGHIVTVSTDNHGHFDTALRTLAHEMIHMAQAEAKEMTTHGPGWDRRAEAVGRALGWDWRAL